MKSKPDVIADLHMWPADRGQGDHELDRDCHCKPTIQRDDRAPNSFFVIHRND